MKVLAKVAARFNVTDASFLSVENRVLSVQCFTYDQDFKTFLTLDGIRYEITSFGDLELNETIAWEELAAIHAEINAASDEELANYAFRSKYSTPAKDLTSKSA